MGTPRKKGEGPLKSAAVGYSALVRFSQRDRALQDREGWMLCNSGLRGYEVQRDDCADSFRLDDDALAHVMRQALKGSKPHIKALVAHCAGREALLCHFLKRGYSLSDDE